MHIHICIYIHPRVELCTPMHRVSWIRSCSDLAVVPSLTASPPAAASRHSIARTQRPPRGIAQEDHKQGPATLPATLQIFK